MAGPGTVADVAQVGATSPTPGNPRRTNQEPSEGVAPTYVRLTPPISRPAHEFHCPPQRPRARPVARGAHRARLHPPRRRLGPGELPPHPRTTAERRVGDEVGMP